MEKREQVVVDLIDGVGHLAVDILQKQRGNSVDDGARRLSGKFRVTQRIKCAHCGAPLPHRIANDSDIMLVKRCYTCDENACSALRHRLGELDEAVEKMLFVRNTETTDGVE